MKILMSAFACCPGRGSEPGIGWNWAVEAAKQGHHVKVLTQTCDRDAIEREIALGHVPTNLTFEYVMPAWLEWFRKTGMKVSEGLSWQLTHLLWQIAAYFHIRKSVQPGSFDLVHHITYGGIRHPTLLGLLPTPLVLGPLGGGDRIPFALRRGFSWSSWCGELLRDLHTWALRFDPITLHACARARAIYVKTAASKHVLPQRVHEKTFVRLEIGTHRKTPEARPPRPQNGPFRLMYAGRFLALKGMHLGFRALAEVRKRGVDVHLTMVGPGGPEADKWKELARSLGIYDAIDWRGWVTSAELKALYLNQDTLLFPSLRDSSGNVVLEAFSAGLPVICLDLGGPGQMVDEGCGRVVPVEGVNERECVMRLASAIEELALSRELLDDLSKGASDQAQHYFWPNVVRDFYADVHHRVEPSALAPAAPDNLTEVSL